MQACPITTARISAPVPKGESLVIGTRQPEFVGRRWPSRDQVLLLRAATGEGESAIAAWREWFATSGFDSAGPAEFSLLPLVAANVTRLGLESAEVPRLLGLYRFNWSRNQLQSQRVKEALAGLTVAGIDSMLLKGAALTALGYYDRGSRVMADIDVMVRPDDAARAVGLLEALGWKRTPERGVPVSELTSLIHGVSLTDARGANLDLHWHMIHRACSPGADGPFWAKATPVEFYGVKTHVPAPSDLLLHACVHGLAWMPAPSFVWICDALALLRRDGIDWRRLVDLAVQDEVVLPLHRALSYLRLAFHADVPEDVTRELEHARVRALDRWQYAIEGGGGLGFLTLTRDIGRYASITRGRPLGLRLRGLPPYLRTIWKVESGWRIPVWIVQEGARRLSSVAGRRRLPWTPKGPVRATGPETS